MSDEQDKQLAQGEFGQQVYKIVRSIPYGRVMTYGQIALLLGMPRSARVVGWALHWVVEKDIPCQRVVNRNGGLAAGYGWGGQVEHRVDIEAEGVTVREDFTVDLDQYQWWPDAETITALELPPEVLERLNQKLEYDRDQLNRANSKLKKKITQQQEKGQQSFEF